MTRVSVERSEGTNRPGVIRHWLSNGLFIQEDPRKGSHKYTLYQCGASKVTDGKILAAAPKLKTLLRRAERE